MDKQSQRGRDGVALCSTVSVVVAALMDEQREKERERQERIGMSARYHCSLPKDKRRALMREMLQKRRMEGQTV